MEKDITGDRFAGIVEVAALGVVKANLKLDQGWRLLGCYGVTRFEESLGGKNPQGHVNRFVTFVVGRPEA